MKKVRLAKLIVSSFIVGVVGMAATVAPTAGATSYSYGNNSSYSNYYNDYWTYYWNYWNYYNQYYAQYYGNNYNHGNNNHGNNNNHHGTRYSQAQIIVIFLRLYPNHHVSHVSPYWYNNHYVYRIYCNNGSWADMDGYSGQMSNGYMR